MSYNGWTNWETWNASLYGYDDTTADLLADEIALIENSFLQSLARSAFEEINWEELKEARLEDEGV